jgi:hypothetical protein
MLFSKSSYKGPVMTAHETDRRSPFERFLTVSLQKFTIIYSAASFPDDHRGSGEAGAAGPFHGTLQGGGPSHRTLCGQRR